MNLSKSPLRRVAGLAAGAVLGLAGVAVAASPAYATDSVIGFTTECDTKTGDWLVHWTVTGNAPEGVEKFRFNAVKAEEGNPVKEVELPDYKVGKEFTHDTNKAITATQRVSTDKTFARLGVEVEFDDGHKDLPRENTATFEGTCEKDKEPPVSPSPSAPSPSPSLPTEEPELPDDLPGEPEPIFELTCDTMTIGFDNPKDSLPIKLGYETSKGEKRSRTIAPGTKGQETFSATEGFFVNLTITVTYEGETYSETVKIDYTEPADCDDETTDPELPLTGAAAGGIAGGAGALLAIGGLLFFLARRRKVKFTA